jgi:DNA-binding winged helix-turn-helix (wHTH) protein/TolB-like protein/Tfp pilus assembly protein PilF
VSDCYAFGDFLLERAQQRVLRADGSALVLTPRLFNALLLFVERPGELLDKDTLMQALWPGLVVEENNLSQVVSGLRRALGDDAQGSRFIQTVPRRGFRFIAPVKAMGAAEAELAPSPVPEAAVAQADVPATRRQLLGALGAGVAAAAGAAWWTWGRGPAVSGAAARVTLAVLPFRPLTAEGRDDLLEVGMADSLAARLSAVPGVVVRSTGSVLRYAGPAQDPLRAAQELDVGWVLDGTLQRRGDRLRATARLLRASDGVAAWSGSFDTAYLDVFDVQDRIATQVMQALTPALRAQLDTQPLTEPGGTRSTEAYQLYVTAAWRAQGTRGDSAAKAVELLQQALAIDPGYAQAWALLAWVHRRKLWRNDAVPTEVAQAADAALQRALALVPQLASARAGVGFSRYWFQFDWEAAEREYRAAAAANPSEVSAHLGLGLLLSSTMGRVDEGLSHMRQARELDPVSPVLNTLEASLLLARGDLDAARVRLDRALDVAPDHGLALEGLGRLLIAERRTDEGLAALRRSVQSSEATTRPKAVLAMFLAQLGRAEEASALLGELLQRGRSRYVPPINLAMVHAALGQAAAALAALQQAYRLRDTRLIFLKDDPCWTPLRREPGFQALLQQLRLDRYRTGLSPV